MKFGTMIAAAVGIVALKGAQSTHTDDANGCVGSSNAQEPGTANRSGWKYANQNCWKSLVDDGQENSGSYQKNYCRAEKLSSGVSSDFIYWPDISATGIDDYLHRQSPIRVPAQPTDKSADADAVQLTHISGGAVTEARVYKDKGKFGIEYRSFDKAVPHVEVKIDAAREEVKGTDTYNFRWLDIKLRAEHHFGVTTVTPNPAFRQFEFQAVFEKDAPEGYPKKYVIMSVSGDGVSDDADADLTQFIDVMKNTENEAAVTNERKLAIDPAYIVNDMIFRDSTAVRYDGSFTAPSTIGGTEPCQHATWFVATKSVNLSNQQVTDLKSLFDDNKSNILEFDNSKENLADAYIQGNFRRIDHARESGNTWNESFAYKVKIVATSPPSACSASTFSSMSSAVAVLFIGIATML